MSRKTPIMPDEITCPHCKARAVKPPAIGEADYLWCQPPDDGPLVVPCPNCGNEYRPRRGGRRSDLGDQYFRSSWEANYARYLTFLEKLGEIDRWEYEPDTFEFHGIKRGTRFYTPDFKVWEDGEFEYFEIKGYMDAKSRTKLKRMGKYHPDVKINLIGADEYRALARDVEPLIPGWESRS